MAEFSCLQILDAGIIYVKPIIIIICTNSHQLYESVGKCGVCLNKKNINVRLQISNEVEDLTSYSILYKRMWLGVMIRRFTDHYHIGRVNPEGYGFGISIYKRSKESALFW